MSALALNRKQRRETLEEKIRSAAASIQVKGLDIGRWLCEIRDEELWEEDYDSWNQYLLQMAEELVGKTFAQAAKLIRAAEVSKRLPEKYSADNDTVITPSHLIEIGRLAPSVGNGRAAGVEKDYSQLRTQDVARVLKAATQLADGKAPSVRELRAAVDADLGIDRAEQSKQTRAKRDEDEAANKRHQVAESSIDRRVEDLIWQIKQYTGGAREMIAAIGEDGWKRWKSDNRVLAKRLAAACREFTGLLLEDE